MTKAITPPLALWGVSDPATPLAGGHRNVVFKTCPSKRPLVFKSSRRTEDAVAWLLPVLELAEAAGFVVPKPLQSLQGTFIAEGWTCEPYIECRTVTQQEMPMLAPLLQEFHAGGRQLPQRPGFLSACALMAAPKGGDVDISAMPADLVALCRKAWAGLDDQAETVIHGDLFPENVLRCPDGRFALIDWDESRRDHPQFDLVKVQNPDKATQRAHLAWEVACSWQLEPEYARRMADRLMALF